jgi:hypothetical protein
MADLFESLVGAVYVDSGFSFEVTCRLATRLGEPIWKTLTPEPDREPVRKFRELFGHLVYIKFYKEAQILTGNDYLLTRLETVSTNWIRIACWKMLKIVAQKPQILELLQAMKRS